MWEISVMHNFQGYFSRTFQDLKLQFPGLSRSWDFKDKNPGLYLTMTLNTDLLIITKQYRVVQLK